MSTDLVRIIAASLNAPKFRGRTRVIHLAQHGDPSALEVLEATAKGRVVLALRGVLSKAVLAALALPEIATQAELRVQRKKRRAQNIDLLALRKPGDAMRRAVLAVFDSMLCRANLREATHAHETDVRYSTSACGAESVTDRVWPSKVGLAHSYTRKGFRVTMSLHRFLVSPAIFKVPRERRWDGKYMWLAPDVRVRQGRGTILVCERRDGRRWVPHPLQMPLPLPVPLELKS